MSESVLMSANRNPWYVLMTLYGEQTGEEIDAVLHERNRAAWNTWASMAMPSRHGEVVGLIRDMPSPDEWHRRGKQLAHDFETEYARRNPGLPVPSCPNPSSNEPIDLKGVEFGCQLHLANYAIPRILYLIGSHFHQGLVAQSTWFQASVSARDCRFEGHVTLQGSRLQGHLDLTRGEIRDGMNLQSAQIQDLLLVHARMKGTLTLVDAQCRGIAILQMVRPLDEAGWDLQGFQVKVTGMTVLDQLSAAKLDLRQAAFDGPLRAVGMEVSGPATFASCKFGAEVDLSGAEFGGQVQFGSSIFVGRAQFASGQFKAKEGAALSLKDCTFQQPANFREAIFVCQYPSIEGTVFHDKTIFSDRDDLWPEGEEVHADLARTSCGAIRHLLGSQGQPEAEHFFFRREMMFAGRLGTWWQRLPFKLFGMMSDYGHSIEKPAKQLLWLWLVPTFVYAAFRVVGDPASDILALGKCAAFSFSTTFASFQLQRAYFPNFVDGQPFLQLIAGAQTVLGVLFLFFLLLGMRTRFRLR